MTEKITKILDPYKDTANAIYIVKKELANREEQYRFCFKNKKDELEPIELMSDNRLKSILDRLEKILDQNCGDNDE